MRYLEKTMTTIGFVIHYPSIEHFFSVTGLPGKLLRRFQFLPVKEIIRLLPPYLFLKTPPLISKTGDSVKGYIVMAPFLPEHLVTWGEDLVLQKILQASRIAERLDAKIIGLGGFASIAGNEGEEISKRIRVAVTSGNTYTAAMALQGLRRAAGLMGIQLNKATAAIIGATGDIGSACARILAREVKALHLAARNGGRLNDLASSLQRENNCSVKIAKYVKDAIHDADLILTATSSMTTLIGPQDVKTGTVICDVAIPHNVATDILQHRNDVFVFEGGLAKLPNRIIERTPELVHLSSDGTTVFGCLAEVMILALEGRLENYSLGRGNITPDCVQEIELMANRHGFQLADFCYDGTRFTEDQINGIRFNAEKRTRPHFFGTISAIA